MSASTPIAQPAKGLTMYLFKNPTFAGCSAGGLSETADKVTIIGIVRADGSREPMPKDARVFTPNEKAPAAVLVERKLFGGKPAVWTVAPADYTHGSGYMAGGAYAGASDSRLTEITGGFYGAFALHDRKEW